MKYLLLFIIAQPLLLFSQTPETGKPENRKTVPPAHPYFQQEVNYKIAVTLDDTAHTVSGSIDIEYINNAPDALNEIWMHLWGNAFKNRETAFCRQKLRDGDTRFYFAEAKDLGYFKNLDFSVDGQKAAWRYDKANPDIALITLTKPLPPGSRIVISTPFVLKIPASFSRLGHVGTSYQMTQWFPKPAVYDNRGWHPMPYLDIGEFYSEFGSFDVTITLPDNYIVGATGVLQTPSEIEFLQRKVEETKLLDWNKYRDTFPASSKTFKTLRYTAEQVHDFAWFADKRFLVQRDTAHLASGRTVDCWSMFTDTRHKDRPWSKSAFYVRRAVEFYSEKVGEYPWPHATAVHSALSAGGGMEYPMITVIGNASSGEDLDDVITHEVGHNWFYGILASNERDHPFMDEGLNSYYEMRYMKQYYASHTPINLPRFILNPEKSGPLLENGYLLLARERLDTPPDTHSDDFTPIAYGLQVYMKTALCMAWLEQAVGAERLDAAMREYYRQWQFRHPYPDDLKKVFQDQGLEAGWFFETVQTQKRADFVLKNAVQEANGTWKLDIGNNGELNAPYSVTALKAGKPVETKWYTSTGTVEFPPCDADAFEIDHAHTVLDLNRKNNMRRTSGFLPAFEPLEVRSFVPFQHPGRSTIAVMPGVGWNNYDKAIIGAIIYNPLLPPRRFQYYLAPGFATGSGRFAGFADLRWKIFTKGPASRITVGLSAKTYDFDYNWKDDYYLKYYRLAPQIRAELHDRSNSFRHYLQFRVLFIGKENDVRTDGAFTGKVYDRYTIYETRYVAKQSKAPNPFHFTAALEWQNSPDAFGNKGKYLRNTLEWKQQYFYARKNKVTLRAFAGFFLQNDRRNAGIVGGDVAQASLALNPQGFNDYRFDEVFLARSGADGMLGRQVSQTEGGFKGAFGSAFAGTFGNSNNFILALNLKADLPRRLPLDIPIKPWFDIGWFDDATSLGSGRPSSEQLLWSGGLMLEFFNGGLEVYFPLINSKTLRDKYIEAGGGTNSNAIFGGGNYLKWISWSIRIRNTEPAEILENIAR